MKQPGDPQSPAPGAGVEAALRLVRPCVSAAAPYVPGLQPASGARLVKLNTNENPYPPSPAVTEAILRAGTEALRLYPSPDSDPLREAAEEVYGVPRERILCGNGSDEILSLIMRTFVGEGEAVSWFRPSYSLYPVLAAVSAALSREVPLPRPPADVPVPRPEGKVFFLTTPNAPYGTGFTTAWISRLLDSFPGIIVADEAYADFAAEHCLSLLERAPRLIVVRTLSKAYSLAGMRIGLAFAHEAVVRELRKVRDSYNVSRLAQEAGSAALRDREHFERTRGQVIRTREGFAARLRGAGLTVLPSQANFLFVQIPARPGAGALARHLLDRGFLVRHFAPPELSDGLRISVGAAEDMDRLYTAIKEGL